MDAGAGGWAVSQSVVTMLPRGCCVVVLALVGCVFVSLPPAATPLSCKKRSSSSTAVQLPVAVKLCVEGKFQANLTFQDEDSNPVAFVNIEEEEEEEKLTVGSRMRWDQPPKLSSLSRSALQGDCLHLEIELQAQSELQLVSRHEPHCLALPVTQTASLRMKVGWPLDFETCFQNPAERDLAAVTPPQNSSEATTPEEALDAAPAEDQPVTREVVLLGVQAGLVGVAVVLSVAVLVLAATLGG